MKFHCKNENLIIYGCGAKIIFLRFDTIIFATEPSILHRIAAEFELFNLFPRIPQLLFPSFPACHSNPEIHSGAPEQFFQSLEDHRL